ncbi:hypothetical protein [Leifsonia shinshuensis]
MSVKKARWDWGSGIEFVGMGDELRNGRLRRVVVAATLHAAEHAVDVIQICQAVDGDESSLRTAIMARFGFDEVQAGAVVSMQVRRFTPHATEQLRAELADMDELIHKLAGSR